VKKQKTFFRDVDINFRDGKINFKGNISSQKVVHTGTYFLYKKPWNYKNKLLEKTKMTFYVVTFSL